MLPARGAWAQSPPAGFDAALMSALVDAMTHGTVAPEARALLEKVGKNKRTALVHETYAKYFEIVEACARGDVQEQLVRDAEALFAQRKKNAFYSGGLQSRGGGPDNDHTIDYVLATVLEWCKRRDGAPAVETIHAWRW